jgi:hypothetical protein
MLDAERPARSVIGERCDQVGDELRELARLGADLQVGRRHRRLQLRARHAGLDLLERARDHVAHENRARLGRVWSSERLEVLDDAGDPPAVIHDHLELSRERRDVDLGQRLEQLDATLDHRERIVDLVRDAAGEVADARQSARMVELLLEPETRRVVAEADEARRVRGSPTANETLRPSSSVIGDSPTPEKPAQRSPVSAAPLAGSRIADTGTPTSSLCGRRRMRSAIGLHPTIRVSRSSWRIASGPPS